MKTATPGTKVGTIYRAKPSNRFRMIHGNREVTRVSKLIASIAKNNMLALFPILVWMDKSTGYLYIVDGQHRFQAAVEMGLDIYYHLTSNKPSIEDIARASEGVIKWNLTMHLESHIARGNHEYKKIVEWMNDHPGSESKIPTIASLLTGDRGATGGNTRDKFIEGKIRVTEVEHTNRVWGLAKMLEENGLDFATSAPMLRAISVACCHPEFDEMRFRRSAKWAKDKIYPTSRTNGLLDGLTDLYSYMSRGKRIDFRAYNQEQIRNVHVANMASNRKK